MTETREGIIEVRTSPGCLWQVLWFAFIGWWLGQIWVGLAWIAMLTIVGIPLGAKMLNSVPTVMALRQPPRRVLVEQGRHVALDTPQRPFIVRALWFVLVGWWLSALWIEVAYALCLTIIGLPLGFWMFDLTPTIATLQRR